MHDHLPEASVGAESNVELDANLEIKNCLQGEKENDQGKFEQ